MSTSIKLNVHFSAGNRSHRQLYKGKQPKVEKLTRLPRIARLMALAVKYDHLLSEGVIDTHRELATLAGVERSHISTVLRFRLLAPDIQEWLINLPKSEKGENPIGMMELRAIAATPSWDKQREKFYRLVASKKSHPQSDDRSAKHKQKHTETNNE